MALTFNGGTSLLTAGSDASIDNNFDGGGTIMAWIQPTDWGESNFGRVLSKFSSGLGWSWFLQETGVSVAGDETIRFTYQFSTTDGNWVAPDNSIALNTWMHVAFSYDADSDANAPTIYIDGESVTVSTTAPSGTRQTDAAQDLRVGTRSSGSRTFDGEIADARMYDRILSAGEVQTIYTARGHDAIIRGLVLRYPLFGQLGVTPSTVPDLSPGGNTGTVTSSDFAADILSLGQIAS